MYYTPLLFCVFTDYTTYVRSVEQLNIFLEMTWNRDYQINP